MDEPEIAVAPAALAQAHAKNSYHFQQFVLQLSTVEAGKLFEVCDDGEERIRATPSREFGLFAHEFSHYLQAVTTRLGQGAVLNWFATLLQITKDLDHEAKLYVPVYGSARISAVEATKAWNLYIREFAALVGLGVEIVPSQGVPYSFEEFDFVHPSDGTVLKQQAIVVPNHAGELMRVPLIGDAFLEGQAQAVQFLVDGQEIDVLQRLLEEPRPGSSVNALYYTAILRFVRARLPDLDPLQATILLCDAALCTRTPGLSFRSAFEFLERNKAKCASLPDWFARCRAFFDTQSDWIEGRRYAVECIDHLLVQVQQAKPETAAYFIRTILLLMRRGWDARARSSDWFFGVTYDGQWLERAVTTVGGPPVFLYDKHEPDKEKEDIDTGFPLTGNQDVTKACYWCRGSYDVLEAVMLAGFTKPCQFLFTRICTFNKTHACREGRLLDVPIVDGHGCHVVAAAYSMNLYGRPWMRRKT